MKLQLDINADSRYGFDRKRVRLAMEKTLVEQGIDSISLNPDTVVKTTLSILKTERKLRRR